MNAKTKKILIISLIVIAIIAIIIVICCNVRVETIEENESESVIIPEEEISDEQLRETTISLYYVNEDNEIAEELRIIDSKILLNEPYLEAMNLLLSGPNSDGLISVIPEGTVVNNIEKSGECLFIDFSKEFIENQSDDVELQGLAISQIVNTMTQFTEINAIKILIEGEENLGFNNSTISFEQLFTNED